MADTPTEDFNFPEQLSPLMEMAIVMHETYSAFMSAGFNEDQSMQLIMNMAQVGIYDEGEEDD